MLSLYRLLLTRIKVVLLADAGLEVEADAVEQHAERKARLLRLANDYEKEGLTEVAEEVRASAHTLHSDQPLSRSLPVATNLLDSSADGCPNGHPANEMSNDQNALLAQQHIRDNQHQPHQDTNGVTTNEDSPQSEVTTPKTRTRKGRSQGSKK